MNLTERAKQSLWMRKYRRVSRCAGHFDYDFYTTWIEGTWELFFEKTLILLEDIYYGRIDYNDD